MKTARILIADDHDVVRQGVRAVLQEQPGWVVCGEARTGRDAVAQAVQLRPDIVVLDISMPDLNGLEAARQIRRVLPAKILTLTVHESEQVLEQVLDAGAHGYVLKADAARKLVEAVHALLDDQEFLTERAPAFSERREAPRRAAVIGRQFGRLTPRQRQVLQLLTEGKSNKEIGTALGISTKTAETHRMHIMARLDLHSMSELVRYAIRNHIIEP
jgi:DNA-binding NarL/FixJ family response regulator